MKLIIAWTVVSIVAAYFVAVLTYFTYCILKNWCDWYEDALRIVIFIAVIILIIWSLAIVSGAI